MPLITCPECRKKISDAALICSNCSYPFPSTKCPFCEEAVSKSATMCPNCDFPVALDQAAPDEIRQLTGISQKASPKRPAAQASSALENEHRETNSLDATSVVNDQTCSGRPRIGCGTQLLCLIVSAPIAFSIVSTFGLGVDVSIGLTVLVGLPIVHTLFCTLLNFIKTGRFEFGW